MAAQRLDGAAIDIATGDGIALPWAGAVRIFGDGRHEGGLRIAIERLCPLDDRPAEIRSAVTGPHQVDFLDRRLTDVADQQVPGHRIEAGAERIAQAQGPDLPTPTAAHERVAPWNTKVASGIRREGNADDHEAENHARY